MCYEMIELKEGEPVVFLGVHALRWNWQEWGEPKVGFIDCDCHEKVEELQAENERLRATLTEIDIEVRTYHHHKRTASVAVIMDNIHYIVLRNLQEGDA